MLIFQLEYLRGPSPLSDLELRLGKWFLSFPLACCHIFSSIIVNYYLTKGVTLCVLPHVGLSAFLPRHT